MKIGDEVYIHGYVDEIRQNVVIIRNDGGYFGTVEEEIKNKSEIPTSCGDAISRQAVLDGLASIAKVKARSDAQKSLMGRVMFFTEQLPSVTPQQKTGRWVWDSKSKVYRCSHCKRFPWRVEYVTDHDEIFEDLTRTNAYKYCPNCGTKMQEVEE